MFINRPAIRFIIPFAAGIILARQFSLSFLLIYITLVIIILVYLTGKITGYFNHTKEIMLILICFLFGACKITYDLKYKPHNNISNYLYLDSIVVFQGIVDNDPDWSDYLIKFAAQAETLITGSRYLKVSGKVLVSFRRNQKYESQLKNIRGGDCVSVKGFLRNITSIRNPGEFDYGTYLRLQNIDAKFFANSIDSSFNKKDGKYNVNARIVLPVRRSLSKKIDKLIGGEEGRFLKGLLLGERSYIAPEVKNAFINAGVMHIIAVSGLHVVSITFIILIILQIFRIPPLLRFSLAGILLVYYALLTGWTPSVVRSVIMAIIYLGGRIVERKTDIYNVVALSAIFILMIDSKQIFHAGFQLSYMAVLSIVYIYPRLNIFSKCYSGNNIFLKLLSGVWNLFAVSLSASIGTVPFVGYYFGKISIVGVIVNIFIVPLSNIILMIGMISIGVSYISLTIASYYAEVARISTTLLLTSVHKISEIPFALVHVTSSYTAWLCLYIIVFTILLLLQNKIKGAIILSLVLINIIIYQNIVSSSEDKLRVTFLDVGQGDAIIIELPDGTNMAIDAGPRIFNFDAGKNVIVPYLHWRGINKIDKLIITHPDADHIGGVSGLVCGIHVLEVLDGGIVRDGFLSNVYCNFVDSLKLIRKIINQGILFGDSSSWRLYILNPKENCLNKVKYDNGSSVVVKIVYGNTSILLTGDIPIESESELVKTFGSFLKSDILKLPHHGSRTSTSITFLEAVKPSLCVISVGENNRFKHPAQEVLDRLKENKYWFLRTDKEGALIFESNGKNWEHVLWR